MIKSFFSVFSLFLYSFSVFASPSPTFQEQLAVRVQEVMLPVAKGSHSVFPGIEMDFSYWEIPLEDLRKEGLRILEKKYAAILENPKYFSVKKKFFSRASAFFSKLLICRKKEPLDTSLFFRMPLLYWENKQFDRAIEVLNFLESQENKEPENLLSDLWTHISCYFAIKKEPPESLLSQVKKKMVDSLQFIEMRNKIAKLSSFYGLNCDVQQMKSNFDYMVQSLKNLLEKEPKIVFLMRRDRSFFHFPDIVKSIAQRMKRPSFWLKNKVEEAFFLLSDLTKYQELFSENTVSKILQNPYLPSFFMAIKEKADCLQLLPYEQALASQIAMLEKKITLPVLKQISQSETVTDLPESVKYGDFLDLAFLYKTAEEIRLREAFQLVSFVQNNYFQTDVRVPLYLAAMHQMGSGTPENPEQAKTYFFEALYGLTKKGDDCLKRNLNVLSIFAYWFDVELPYDPEKEALTPAFAFQIFSALLQKGASVENAFLQAYANESDYYLWDLLQKAFQDQGFEHSSQQSESSE